MHNAIQSEQSVMGSKNSRIHDFLTYPVLNKEPINITASYDRHNKLFKAEFENKKHVPLPILKLFLCIAEYHPTLHYLNMRCKINQQTIHVMSKYLPTCNITHLNLDDTFIPEANYYILLGDGSKLKELSLARCNINDIAVSLIAEKLAYPNGAARVLTALTLSSNQISDIGAFNIAAGLRCNRKLVYLNLAGNQLTDVGASEILKSLIPFPLTDAEYEQRIKDHVPYMLQKLVFFKELRKRIDIEIEREKRRTLKRSIKKVSAEKKQLAEQRITANKKLFPGKKPSSEKKGSTEKYRESVVPNEEDMEKNPMRPFRSQDLYVADNTLWSYGNNILCYINFAYNDLTCIIVQRLHEVLKQQQTFQRDPKGLLRVRLEGNLIPTTCREMKEVQAMFEAKTERFPSKPRFLRSPLRFNSPTRKP